MIDELVAGRRDVTAGERGVQRDFAIEINRTTGKKDERMEMRPEKNPVNDDGPLFGNIVVSVF